MMFLVFLYAIYWGINHVDRLKKVARDIGVHRWFQSVFSNPYVYPSYVPQQASTSVPTATYTISPPSALKNSYIRILDASGNVIRETSY